MIYFQGGVVLLLLGSLHSVNSEIEKSPVPLCGIEWSCITTDTCMGGLSSMDLTTFSTQLITGDCKMIMKIRAYSAKKYRVSLESRDPNVNKLVVNKENTVLFSCEEGLQPKYKGAHQKSINHTEKPKLLMCEFIAEEKDEQTIVRSDEQTNIAIFANDVQVAKGKEFDLYSKIKRDSYCNPEKIAYDPAIERLIIGLTDLSCLPPYYIETRLKDNAGKLEPKHIKTTSIDCVKTGDTYEYVIMRENNKMEFTETLGRCAARSCTLCDWTPEVEGIDFTIFEESDGCKKLKCKTGKLNGDSMGVATCKMTGDKSAWDLNGKTIEKDDKVTCDTKLECRSPVPFSCPNDETAILDSKNVAISCDYNTGNWTYYQEGTVVTNPDPAKLSCLSKESKGSNDTGSQTKSASGTTIGVIVGGILILIALIAGIAIYLNRRRNAQNNNIGKTTKSQEPFSIQPTSKSKKSKKEPNICMGVDMSTVPTPSVPPVSPEPYKRPPPPQQVMLNAADIPSNATTGTDGIKRKKVTPDGGTNKGGDTTGAETGPFNIDETAINKKGFRRVCLTIVSIRHLFTCHVDRSMLLLFLLALIGTVNAVCPTGYQQINGGDCFKLYTTTQNYDNAEAECVKDGAHLASVHSLNEQNALMAIMGMTTPLIGMKCMDAVAAHCTWADGSIVDFSKFPGGAPLLAYGNCVHLASTDTNWYSWNCAAVITGFLCRVPLNAPPVAECTNGYVAYNGGCAALKTTSRVQSDAEASCALEGGHLASIHTEADNTFYAQLGTNAGLTNNIYVGLAWNTAANNYKWTDDSTYNFKKFANQFPNTVFGECVYSPNFPVSIPAGQTCEWVLATAVGTKVSMQFPIFNTDAGTTLSLYNGLDDTTPTNRLSGNAINPLTAYESTTNVMKMIFTPSAAPTGTGFQANFIPTGGVIPDPQPTFDPITQCPQQQYTADTYVYSPNWPEPYPPMSDCLYYIHSRDGKKMSIEFGYVDTEQCCDIVVVYDAPDNKDESKIIAYISGQSAVTPKTYYSTGTTLTLQFFSDSNNQGEGWIATVRNL
ncbi:clec-41 [Pristionchus pacificus]|uniref:Clec-41 n=1 Tax=Pristionchus pacificus TaxID=54126 RepID=A0A2A6CAS3_PRIPA|nr:clec-41 [Pristionchus pacificus]|eukprot:PDM75121.1 clec-41 [Pristionchus pacificus]